MIILILTIILLVIGIMCLVHYFRSDNYFTDVYLLIGLIFLLIFGIVLLIEGILLLYKPLDYTDFKIKYETVSELSTSKEDIRDATYTMQLIEINNEIRINKEYVNNPWIGIFYNKDIANMQLLNKE